VTNDLGKVGEINPPTHALQAPSLSRRMACWLYEGMLLFGVIFISGYLFSTLSQTRNALDNRLGMQVFIFLVLGIYFSWFWSKGQTLAMKTWHIRVTTRDGQALSQGQALWRYILSWVWFWPPIVMAKLLDMNAIQVLMLMIGWIVFWAMMTRFQIQRQFWHDVWARTYLVQDQLKAVTNSK
jgi:uncharacterized RDD family membrane protein YckC